MLAAWFYLAVHLAAMAGYAIAALSSVRCMRQLETGARFTWISVVVSIGLWISVLLKPRTESVDKPSSTWQLFWLGCNVSAVTSGLMFMAMARALLNFEAEVAPASYPYYLAGHLSVPICFVFMHIGISNTWQKAGPQGDE